MQNLQLDQEMEIRLVAYFNGETDREEEERIGKWLDERPEHREAYESFLKNYLHIRWAQEEGEIQTEQVKKVILASLKRPQRRWRYVSAAASVMLLLGTMWMWMMQEESVAVPEQTSLAEIPPVHSQAILVLSTGEQVDLNCSGDTIVERDGSIVKVDSNRRICYDLAPDDRQEEMKWHKVVVPFGGEYQIALSDGTKVWLNAGSELEYPVKFASQNREVHLKGEAYFSVTKDSLRPFRVQAGACVLCVYGTEFNLNVYDSLHIQAVLVRGSVGIRANASAPERILRPKELAVANMVTGETEIRAVDVYPYVAWKNRDFVFVDERLESMMEKVARWYDVQVFFQNEQLKDLRFDGNVPRYAKIEELFFFLEKTSSARFRMKGRTIIIRDR